MLKHKKKPTRNLLYRGSLNLKIRQKIKRRQYFFCPLLLYATEATKSDDRLGTMLMRLYRRMLRIFGMAEMSKVNKILFQAIVKGRSNG